MHPNKIVRSMLSFAVAAVFMMAAPIARAAEPTNGFVPLGEAHSFKDAPTVTEWRFEDVRGTSPIDKIGLHHVAIGKEPPPEIPSW